MNASARTRSASPVRSRAGTLALLGLLVVASGCSMFDRRDRLDERLPDPDLVAQDLVYTLAQIPELHPLRTTLQISEPTTPFGRRVLARLGEAGYGLQHVEADQGPNYVRYRIEHAESETGERTRYRVAIGLVSVERDYEVTSEGTSPESVQLVRGIDPRPLVVNEDLFGGTTPERLASVAFEVDEEPVVRDLSLGAAAPVPVSTSAMAVAAEIRPPSIGGGRDPSNFGAAVKRNMYETLRSNYADVFVDYEDIEQSTLIFPNDSLRLGEDNKATIARYVSELDPATDVLSVIGCSHGNTEIDNGNELLAIGRANRVKEAFLFAGIDHRQVLEESCWAPTYFDPMPRRGVVLTLKRRRGLG